MNDRVGQQFGNYRLIRLLGQGGFAEVYLGEHIHLKTLTAIKVTYGKMSTQDVALFTKEAQTLAALKHPHILRVLDFGINQTLPYLIMDYASNGSLRDRHPEGSILPLSTIVPYVKQIASALAYTHANKLIHRDVKPENILVDEDEKLLLSDFGIVAIAHSTTSMKTVDNLGTVHYMAPEHIKKKPRPASDQYALATMIYEWITGETPFTGDSLVEIAMSKFTDDPPTLSEKIPTIPPQVEQVVLKGLAKDPQERFPSVEDFSAALEQASITTQILSLPPVTPRLVDEPDDYSALATPAFFVPKVEHKPVIIYSDLPSTINASPPTTSSTQFSLPNFTEYTLSCTYRGHAWGATSLALSPDGCYLASTGHDYMISIWEMSSGKRLSSYRKSGDGLFSDAISWSPDGQYIASGQWSTITVYNALTGVKIYSCNISEVLGNGKALEGLAWSPLGDSIVVFNRKILLLLDATTGKFLYEYKRSKAYNSVGKEAYTVAWSPNGKYIASANDGFTIQVWDVHAKEYIFTYEGHKGPINTIAWSPDGKYIASSSDDYTVQVWNANCHTSLWHNKEELTLVTYKMDEMNKMKEVRLLVWSPASTYIAWAYEDVVVVWDVHTRTKLYSYQESANPKSTLDHITSILWSPDGQGIITASLSKIHYWSHHRKNHTTIYQGGHLARVERCIWSPDGKYITSEANDETIQVWEALTGKVFRKYTASNSRHTYPDWSPNSQYIAITSSNSSRPIEIWDVSREKRITTYEGPEANIKKIAWSPDGNYIAASSGGHTVHVWDVHSGMPLCTYEGHNENLIWSPDSKYIASSNSAHTIQVWDAYTGKCLCTYKGHTEKVKVLTWSPDSKYIASGGDGEIVHIWEARTGKHRFSYSSGRKEKASYYSVVSIAWSPDGKYIAMGFSFGPLHVWKAFTKKQLISDDVSYLRTLLWSPDSHYLVGCWSNHRIHVWERSTGKCIHIHNFNALNHTELALTWLPNGIGIASAEIEGIRVWQAFNDT